MEWCTTQRKLIGAALILMMLGMIVATLKSSAPHVMLTGYSPLDSIPDMNRDDLGSFDSSQEASSNLATRPERSQPYAMLQPTATCLNCPHMPLKLIRPKDTQTIDVFVVNARCNDYVVSPMECLDYLRDRSDEYLVERKEAPPPCDEDHPMIVHAYWRGKMGETVPWMLKSFLFSQNLRCARYWLWVDDIAITQEEADNLAVKEEEEFVKRLEEERKMLAKNITVEKPATRTQGLPFNYTDHANALRQVLEMRPYVTLRQFKLSEKLLATTQLNATQWSVYQRWKSNSATAHCHKVVDHQGKHVSIPKPTPPPVAPNSTAPPVAPVICPKISEHITLPKYDWPAQWMESNAQLKGWAVAESDMVRLALLELYGGLYVDTDVMFLRDLRPYVYTPLDWAYAWSWQEFHNTALLHFHPGSSTLETLIRQALSHNNDFHPRQLLRYLQHPKARPMRATIHAERRLAMFSCVIFDATWNWIDGIRDQSVLPQFGEFPALFKTGSNRNFEFSHLLATKVINETFLHQISSDELRTIDRFFNGAPAYHMHGIVRTIEPQSWAWILKQHFDCFWNRGLCPNIYGEYRRMAT